MLPDEQERPRPEATEHGETDLPGVHPKHLAAARAGSGLLRAAHSITEGLAQAGAEDDGVVVLRTDGPHRSFAALEALIDDALAESDASPAEPDDAPAEPDDALAEPDDALAESDASPAESDDAPSGPGEESGGDGGAHG